MNLQEFKEKVKKEHDEIIDEGLRWSIKHDENEHVYFVMHAYEIAHYNEILYFFEDMEEEEWDENWKNIMSKINPKANILRGVYYSWLDYRHPEMYNFFCYEDMIAIIKNWAANN